MTDAKPFENLTIELRANPLARREIKIYRRQTEQAVKLFSFRKGLKEKHVLRLGLPKAHGQTLGIHNRSKSWTREDDAILKKLADENTPAGLIAHELGRSEGDLYSHASEIDISLQPQLEPV